MKYQVLVLDLDGTLTIQKNGNTAPTKQALLEIQEAGRTVVSCQRAADQRCCASCKRTSDGYFRRIHALL